MKRYLALLPALVALALPAVAAASPYNRNCGTSADGWLLGPFNYDNEAPWMVNGPWHINMTKGRAQVQALLRRFSIQEFGTRFALSGVPCAVAQGVTISASEKWVSWPGDSGWVNVHLSTSGGDVYVGLFHCTGYDLPTPERARETCTMRYRGGTIIGAFTISDNPYYP